MNAFAIVREFERVVAEFAGAKHAVAVNTGTSAIFLSLKFIQTQAHEGGAVVLPAHTFISVPMAVLQAGMQLKFDDYAWSGVYAMKPHPVIDGALRFRKGMYQGGLHCLSFHARKHLNIGEGGMVLTDNPEAAAWIRKASYSGRDEAAGYRVENISMMGWQMYMNPEKAARGLHLMEYIAPDLPDQHVEYVDLRKSPIFKECL